MPSRSPAIVPIEVLREAIRQRVSASSLRVAAVEVGLSWKGIDKFLAGSTPHRATVRKFTDWYLRWSAAEAEVPSPETVEAALAVIVRHLPPAHRDEAAAAAMAAVRKVGESHGQTPPAWLIRPK